MPSPKGVSNSLGRPRPWPVTDTFSLRCAICALSNVAMGLSGKIWQFRSPQETEREELAFCRGLKSACNLFEATPGTPFQVGHSKNPNAKKRCHRPIEIELVRLRPTTLHSKEPTCFYICRHKVFARGVGEAGTLSNNKRVIISEKSQDYNQETLIAASTCRRAPHPHKVGAAVNSHEGIDHHRRRGYRVEHAREPTAQRVGITASASL